MSAPRVIRHVVVHGKVQGVGFRDFVDGHAQRHNLEGWVRNRRDGTVEAVFAGERTIVDDMIAACRKGPSSSRVDRIDQRDAVEDELTVRGAGAGFVVLPTV